MVARTRSAASISAHHRSIRFRGTAAARWLLQTHGTEATRACVVFLRVASRADDRLAVRRDRFSVAASRAELRPDADGRLAGRASKDGRIRSLGGSAPT